jgi:hypothetical protein
MEERLERLERLVERLVDEVRRCNELLELAVRRGVLRVEGGKKRVEVLRVKDLGEGELRVLEEFFEWAEGKKYEWVMSYEEGRMEGYDRRRGWLILRRGVMNEFLDLVSDLGYSRQGVLGLLGDLGILRYWEKKSGRQYCIAVRVDKPSRCLVKGRYVLVVDRMREVREELRGLRGVRGGGGVEEKPFSD